MNSNFVFINEGVIPKCYSLKGKVLFSENYVTDSYGNYIKLRNPIYIIEVRKLYSSETFIVKLFPDEFIWCNKKKK